MASLETLNKYAFSIRELHYGYVDSVYHALQCTRLTHLEINGGSMTLNQYPKESTLIAEMIQRNYATLQCFSLHHRPILSSTILWNALAQCNLSEIKLSSNNISFEDAVAFWEACSKAKKLFIEGVTFDMDYISLLAALPPEGFPNLIELKVSLSKSCDPRSQFVIAERAPNINSLYLLLGQEQYFPIDNYRLAMTNRIFTNLHSLTILHHALDDVDIDMTLNAMTRAKRLHLRGSRFSGKSYLTLMSNHAKTIQHLDLLDCTTVTSAMVQGILSGCPALESFLAKVIKGTDLVRIVSPDFDYTNNYSSTEKVILGKDWVCFDLKTLVVHFDLGGAEAGIDQSTPEGEARFLRQQQLEQQHTFRQLSRLIELETLDFRSTSDFLDRDKYLDLRLKRRGGQLEQLATLTKLKYVYFHNADQDLSKQEIDWMLKHWPRLIDLRGTFYRDVYVLSDYVRDSLLAKTKKM
ncbi:hypothetical protein BGZ46_004095 [Entomortierella lignicola]|nr:hypothetical protein BGZ46_004095 [Entomortierella lignicola]